MSEFQEMSDEIMERFVRIEAKIAEKERKYPPPPTLFEELFSHLVRFSIDLVKLVNDYASEEWCLFLHDWPISHEDVAAKVKKHVPNSYLAEEETFLMEKLDNKQSTDYFRTIDYNKMTGERFYNQRTVVTKLDTPSVLLAIVPDRFKPNWTKEFIQEKFGPYQFKWRKLCSHVNYIKHLGISGPIEHCVKCKCVQSICTCNFVGPEHSYLGTSSLALRAPVSNESQLFVNYSPVGELSWKVKSVHWHGRVCPKCDQTFRCKKHNFLPWREIDFQLDTDIYTIQEISCFRPQEPTVDIPPRSEDSGVSDMDWATTITTEGKYIYYKC